MHWTFENSGLYEQGLSDIVYYIIECLCTAISTGCLTLLKKDITISSSSNSASVNTHSQGCNEKGNNTINNNL